MPKLHLRRTAIRHLHWHAYRQGNELPVAGFLTEEMARLFLAAYELSDVASDLLSALEVDGKSLSVAYDSSWHQRLREALAIAHPKHPLVNSQ